MVNVASWAYAVSAVAFDPRQVCFVQTAQVGLRFSPLDNMPDSSAKNLRLFKFGQLGLLATLATKGETLALACPLYDGNALDSMAVAAGHGRYSYNLNVPLVKKFFK